MQSPAGGIHVAIIMDGNGRWALHKGLTRAAADMEGLAAMRRVVDAAPVLGITTLTLTYDGHLQHEAGETATTLLQGYLDADVGDLVRRGIRLSFIGRRDRLPAMLVQRMERAERATCDGGALHLRMALDNSARHAVVAAMLALAQQARPDFDQLEALIAQAEPGDAQAWNIDLLIRTGGGRRMSDCLLWEAAYAEFLFSDRMWPDFSVDDLRAAVADFRRRDRRFGSLGTRAASA